MTAPIEITLKLASWKELPDKLVETLAELAKFWMMSKALDDASEVAAAQAADQALGDVSGPGGPVYYQEAPHPNPLPTCGGERERVEEAAPAEPPPPPVLPPPHAEIIDALMADLDTAEVTTILIKPLLERWPDIRGEPKHVLGKTAAQFKYYGKRELEFARDHLLDGKHEFFPDQQEIYAWLGKFKGYQARKRAEVQQRELSTNGARL